MNTEHTNQSRQAANAAFEQWWQRHGMEDPMDDEDRQYATASSWARRGYLAAMQAQQAEPVARDVIAKLVALTRAVNIALDDSEERDGIDGREHVIGSVNFDAVCDALEALEELPDNKPGWTMSAADKAEWALRHLSTAQPPAVAVPTIKLGLYGRAFDTPQTRRAYTYQHQPDNLDAYKLGRAAASTSPGGDSIDHGLSLLKELQAHGFGVFELGDQQEGGA